MDIIHTTNKGKTLDTMEKFYIKKTRINNQINDKRTVKANTVFHTLILKNTDRAHIILQQPVPPYVSQSPVLLTRQHT
jgi:hypothetical protein